MTAICQNSLADAPWMDARTRRLPGVQPLDPAQWIVVDEAYGAQMAARADLLARRREDVLQTSETGSDAIAELFQMVLTHLSARPEFQINQAHCVRPDGVRLELPSSPSLDALAGLVTEDFCILQKKGGEHVLTAALLCFPASWTLAQKFGHPLSTIHDPVDSYTDDMAKRVQRLFDAVRPGKPLWRANAMRYQDPTLYQPRTVEAPRTERQQGSYIRSERQCILRLPETDAVVFSIHTRQVKLQDLTAQQAAALAAHPIDHEVAIG